MYYLELLNSKIKSLFKFVVMWMNPESVIRVK